MRYFVVLLSILLVSSAPAQAPRPSATLRSILLEQLHSIHDKQEWFVPVNNAVAGLTPEQARAVPAPGAHSAGMLANHLLLWNTESLARFNGETPKEVTNNDETFNSFNAASWPQTVAQLDAVLTAWEKAVANADDAKLTKWASTISHVATHNAYHVGQILYVRKLQGNWNPDKGVKL